MFGTDYAFDMGDYNPGRLAASLPDPQFAPPFFQARRELSSGSERGFGATLQRIESMTEFGVAPVEPRLYTSGRPRQRRSKRRPPPRTNFLFPATPRLAQAVPPDAYAHYGLNTLEFAMTSLPETALIVGGGFSGMTAAIELKKRGVDVESSRAIQIGGLTGPVSACMARRCGSFSPSAFTTGSLRSAAMRMASNCITRRLTRCWPRYRHHRG